MAEKKKIAAKPTKKPAQEPEAQSVLRSYEENAGLGLLYDYYGQLLSDRQQEIYALYYEEDYSLSEIGRAQNLTRQAVHGALLKSRAKLTSFEEKVGLIEKHKRYLDAVSEIEELAAKLLDDEAIKGLKDKKDSDRIRRQLNKIKKTASDLDI